MSEVKVTELNALIENIKTRREEADKAKTLLTAMNNEISALEQQAVAYLDELGQSSYKSPHGTVGVAEKWRFNLPDKDNGDMTKFFDYAKEIGAYDRLATVNSNSFNSFVLAEWEEAKKQGKGMEFNIPGVSEPKLFKQFSFRKA